jgi:hypothetical protein
VVACGLCWAVVLAYLVGTHSLTDWSNRIALTQSFATSALSAPPLNFFYGLGRHAFAHSWLSAIFTLVIALSLALAGTWLAIRQKPASATLPGVLGLVLITFLIATFSYERDLLSSSFAQAALIFVGLVWIGPLLLRTPPVPSGVLFLISMSALGAVICATFTYYFSPHRSWLSGILALPFAFGVGLNHLLASNRELPRVLNGMVVLALGLTAALAANNHYAFIFRDADPQNLSAPFRVPKLRNVRSTDERVRAVNALYEYLQPRVKSGERMLAYDSCPMLYFLFDTLSAYGWAGAKRYNLTHETLARLNREMLEKPLPRYAVRALVDVSDPVWSTAPRLSYVDYPLNETVMANYVLEQTIFPFEVWRLKTLPASDR